MDEDDAHEAYDDLVERFAARRHAFVTWFSAASQTAGRVALSDAAILAIEAGLRREIGDGSRLATAWIVNVCWDVEEQLRDAGHDHRRSFPRIALDNATAIARTRSIADLTRLPTHAAAQIGTMLDHIESNHI